MTTSSEREAREGEKMSGVDNVQWSAMSKVVRPESAYRSMASTASSRSIRPHPPLACHIPFRTRQIASESLPLLTVTCRFSVLVFTSEHRIEVVPVTLLLVVMDELNRVKRWLWLTTAAISRGLCDSVWERREEEEEEEDKEGEMTIMPLVQNSRAQKYLPKAQIEPVGRRFTN